MNKLWATETSEKVEDEFKIRLIAGTRNDQRNDLLLILSHTSIDLRLVLKATIES